MARGNMTLEDVRTTGCSLSTPGLAERVAKIEPLNKRYVPKARDIAARKVK